MRKPAKKLLSLAKAEVLHDWMLEFPGKVVHNWSPDTKLAWALGHTNSVEEAAKRMVRRLLGEDGPPKGGLLGEKVKYWKTNRADYPYWYVSCFWFGFYVPREAPL